MSMHFGVFVEQCKCHTVSAYNSKKCNLFIYISLTLRNKKKTARVENRITDMYTNFALKKVTTCAKIPFHSLSYLSYLLCGSCRRR